MQFSKGFNDYNEYEDVFYSDIREKKKAGTGFHHMTHGKAKAMHNAWGKYTDKEIKNMAGEVFAINTKKPERIMFKDLKKMPLDIIAEWFRAVDQQYGVGAVPLGKAIGCSENGVRDLRKKCGALFSAERNPSQAKEKIRRLYEDWGINADKQEDVTTRKVDIVETVPVVVQQEEPDDTKRVEFDTDTNVARKHMAPSTMKKEYLSVRLGGILNEQDILNELAGFLGKDVEINIEVKLKE